MNFKTMMTSSAVFAVAVLLLLPTGAFATEKAEVAAEENAAAAEEEAKTHAKHMGMIERLEQIATATSNENLTAKVATLREKEAKRHSLAKPDEA